MNWWGKIKRTITEFSTEVIGYGGVTENRMISPKGLYSNPEKENGLLMPVGDKQEIILPIQKEVTYLEKNDIVVTDDKSHIWFKNKDGIIEQKSDKFIIETKKGTTIDGEKNYINGDQLQLSGKNGVTVKGDVVFKQDVIFEGKVTIKGKLTVNGDTEIKGILKNKNINMTTHTHLQTNAPYVVSGQATGMYAPGPPVSTKKPK